MLFGALVEALPHRRQPRVVIVREGVVRPVVHVLCLRSALLYVAQNVDCLRQACAVTMRSLAAVWRKSRG